MDVVEPREGRTTQREPHTFRVEARRSRTGFVRGSTVPPVAVSSEDRRTRVAGSRRAQAWSEDREIWVHALAPEASGHVPGGRAFADRVDMVRPRVDRPGA
jgi:hypothetical protein